MSFCAYLWQLWDGMPLHPSDHLAITEAADIALLPL